MANLALKLAASLEPKKGVSNEELSDPGPTPGTAGGHPSGIAEAQQQLIEAMCSEDEEFKLNYEFNQVVQELAEDGRIAYFHFEDIEIH